MLGAHLWLARLVSSLTQYVPYIALVHAPLEGLGRGQEANLPGEPPPSEAVYSGGAGNTCYCYFTGSGPVDEALVEYEDVPRIQPRLDCLAGVGQAGVQTKYLQGTLGSSEYSWHLELSRHTAPVSGPGTILHHLLVYLQ